MAAVECVGLAQRHGLVVADAARDHSSARRGEGRNALSEADVLSHLVARGEVVVQQLLLVPAEVLQQGERLVHRRAQQTLHLQDSQPRENRQDTVARVVLS
eukprot:scaffold1503_cov150-Ochromonas_danica.AAC.19